MRVGTRSLAKLCCVSCRTDRGWSPKGGSPMAFTTPRSVDSAPAHTRRGSRSFLVNEELFAIMAPNEQGVRPFSRRKERLPMASGPRLGAEKATQTKRSVHRIHQLE